MPISVPKSSSYGQADQVPNEATLAEEPLRYIRGAFSEFFQIYFSGKPRGSGLHWDEDPKASEIVISSEVPISHETRQDRPALILARGPISFMHLGLDDMDSYDHATGQIIKRMLIQGSLVVQALGREIMESEQLGFEATTALWALRDMLQRRGFFQVGQNVAVGAVSQAGSLVPADSGDEVYATPCSLPFHFPWGAQVTPLDLPILANMDVILRTRSAPEPKETGQGPAHAPFGLAVSAPGKKSYSTPYQGNPAATSTPTYPSRPYTKKKGDLPLRPKGVGTSTPESDRVIVRYRVY